MPDDKDNKLLIYRSDEVTQEMREVIGAKWFEAAHLDIYTNPNPENDKNCPHIGNNLYKFRSPIDNQGRKQGRDEGARIIYYYDKEDNIVVFLEAYSKNTKEDLSTSERAAHLKNAKQIVEKLKAEIKEAKATNTKLKTNGKLFYFTDKYTEAKIKKIRKNNQDAYLNGETPRQQESKSSDDPQLQREIERFADAELDLIREPEHGKSARLLNAIIGNVERLVRDANDETRALRQEVLENFHNFKDQVKHMRAFTAERAAKLAIPQGPSVEPSTVPGIVPELKPETAVVFATQNSEPVMPLTQVASEATASDTSVASNEVAAFLQKLSAHITQVDIERWRIAHKIYPKIAALKEKIDSLSDDSPIKKQLEIEKIQLETDMRQRQDNCIIWNQQIKEGTANSSILNPDLSTFSLRNLYGILQNKTHTLSTRKSLAFIRYFFTLKTLVTELKGLLPASFSSYQELKKKGKYLQSNKTAIADSIENIEKNINNLNQEKTELQDFIKKATNNLASLSPSDQEIIKNLISNAELYEKEIQAEIHYFKNKSKIRRDKLDEFKNKLTAISEERILYEGYHAEIQLPSLDDLVEDKLFFSEYLKGEDAHEQLSLIEDKLDEIRENIVHFQNSSKGRKGLSQAYSKWAEELEEKIRELKFLRELEIFQHLKETHQKITSTIRKLEGQRTFLLTQQENISSEKYSVQLEKVESTLTTFEKALLEVELGIIEIYNQRQVSRWKNSSNPSSHAAPVTKALYKLKIEHAAWWAGQGLSFIGRHLYELEGAIASAHRSIQASSSTHQNALSKAIQHWQANNNIVDDKIVGFYKTIEKQSEYISNAKSAHEERQVAYNLSLQQTGEKLQQDCLERLSSAIGSSKATLYIRCNLIVKSIRKYVASLRVNDAIEAERLSTCLEAWSKNREDNQAFVKLEQILNAHGKLPEDIAKAKETLQKAQQTLQENTAKYQAVLQEIKAIETAKQEAYRQAEAEYKQHGKITIAEGPQITLPPEFEEALKEQQEEKAQQKASIEDNAKIAPVQEAAGAEIKKTPIVLGEQAGAEPKISKEHKNNTKISSALAAFFPWQDWFDNQKPLFDVTKDLVQNVKKAGTNMVRAIRTPYAPSMSRPTVVTVPYLPVKQRFAISLKGAGNFFPQRGHTDMLSSLIVGRVIENFTNSQKIIQGATDLGAYPIGLFESYYGYAGKINGGPGVKIFAASAGAYVATSSVGPYLSAAGRGVMTAGRMLTLPGLAAFGAYKIFTYDPVGSTGKDDYHFEINRLQSDQVKHLNQPIDEPHVCHLQFEPHGRVLATKQDYKKAKQDFDSYKPKHSANGVTDASWLTQEQRLALQQEEFAWRRLKATMEAARADYDQAVQEEQAHLTSLATRVGLVAKFKAEYEKELDLKRNIALHSDPVAYAQLNPPPLPFERRLVKWDGFDEQGLKILEERYHRARTELLTELGLDKNDRVVIHMDQEQISMDKSLVCHAKPQPSALERTHEQELIQKIRKADDLRDSCVKAQQMVEKCYADGLLVVSQSEHDRRVAAFNQAEKAYHQHLEDFLPGIIHLGGNKQGPDRDILVHGYDHVYALQRETINGLETIKTTVHRRDLNQPVQGGAIYNPDWANHVKTMNVAQNQVDRVEAAGRGVENILTMASPALKIVKSLHDTQQAIGGLFAMKK